jgi:hypothetical protein
VRFIKTDGDQLVFQLGRREKDLLLDLLKLYPVVPESHHRISQGAESPALAANQKLLEEALLEHRTEKKAELEAMLGETNRFQECPSGYLFRLTPYELEWLLQVLNDVRVGSWIILGSPNEKQDKALHLDTSNARHLWAMELCGHFQYALLSAQEAA